MLIVQRKRRYVPKRRTKRYSKRRYVRRIPKAIGIPNAMYTKLKYSDWLYTTLTAGTYSDNYFRLNSLYDPDYTAAGHQPYYFDQYTSMYQKYLVYGVKVTVRASATTSVVNAYFPEVLMFIYPGPTTPGWGSDNNIKELPKSAFKFVPLNQSTYGFSRYYSISSAFGVSKRALASEDDYSALYNASPNNLVWLGVRWRNHDSTASVSAAYQITLTFYAKFFDRFQPIGS